MKRRILDVLEQSPATSAEIAAELEIQVGLASAHLCALRDRGFIKVLRTLASPKGTGGRPAKLFAVLEAQP